MNRIRNLFFLTICFCLAFTSVGCQQKKAEQEKKTGQENHSVISGAGIESNTKKEKKQKEITILLQEETGISKECIQAINEKFLGKGVPYSIRFMVCPENERSASDYHKWLQLQKKKGIGDIVCTGCGDATLDRTYDDAVKKKLLDCMDSYLDSSKGEKLKKAYPEKIWKSTKIKGKTYGVAVYENALCGYLYVDESKVRLDSDEQSLEGEDVTEVMLRASCTENSKKCYGQLNRNLLWTMGYVEQEAQCIWAKKNGTTYQMENIYEDEFIIQQLENVRKLSMQYKMKGMQDVGGEGQIEENDLAWNSGCYGVMNGYEDGFVGGIKEELIKRKSYRLGRPILIPVRNDIWGICSWSSRKNDAYRLFSILQTDRDIANLFYYGREGKEYTLKNGKVAMNPGYNSHINMPVNHFITFSTEVEPENKAKRLKQDIQEANLLSVEVCYPDANSYAKKIDMLNKICDKYDGLWKGKFKKVRKTVQRLNKELKAAGLQKILSQWNQKLS